MSKCDSQTLAGGCTITFLQKAIRALARVQRKRYNACNNPHKEIPMAEKAQVQRLKRSVAEWNEWRMAQPDDFYPDLRGADFNHVDLG
jgi:hypothetical protein